MRATGGLGLIAALILVAACGSDDSHKGFGGEEPTQARDPNLPSNLLVKGLKVKDVAVFQGVKVPVVEDADVYGGKITSPVVANRPGIVRVYVDADASFKKGKVTAELRLVDADGNIFPTIRETKSIDGASTEEDDKSTFNLEFPGTSFPAGVSFQVWLTSTDGAETADDTASTSRYPANGTLWQDLGAEASGKVKVVLVPIIYKADGSNRPPTTTEEQLKLYKDTLMAEYPTEGVELTLHEPFEYDAPISGVDGQSYSDILTAIRELRYKDDPKDDVYYYGSFMAGKTFESFCKNGCIAGLSTVADDYKASSLRASVGVGYPGQQSADTLAHEVGHAHGREHAPCGNPDGVDSKFPYDDANLGAWGYNFLTKEFFAPKEGHDIMAYCDNRWVSDYTYNALFKRIQKLNTWVASQSKGDEEGLVLGDPSASSSGAKEEADGYSVAAIDANGNAKWERDSMHTLTGGIAKATTIFGAKGDPLRTTTARFFPYDHIPGGVLFVPKRARESFTHLQVEGFTKGLVH